MENSLLVNFLSRLIKSIASQFGENCEVVLHDFHKEFGHTIIAIENGHITGRKIGDTASNLGLELLRGIKKDKTDYVNYVTRTASGKVIRSSTVYFNDDQNNLAYSIGINYDITNLLSFQKEISTLINLADIPDENIEYLTINVEDLLDKLIAESFKKIAKPIEQMTKEDKIKAFEYLDIKGAFLIKKSGDKVSNFYNVSKYTLYSYLEEIRSNLS